MNWSRAARRRLSMAVLAICCLSLAACGSDPAPSAAPSAELSVDDLLSSAAQKLADMTTAQFEMIDELESGAKFFGTTFKSMEAEVKSPDSVRMLVDVVAPGLGFVKVEIVAVGEQAFIKFSEDAPPLPLPLDQVPFNFGAVGVSLSEVVPLMENATIVGEDVVSGTRTIRVDGDVVSEDLSSLITSADPGHAVALSLWFDETEHTLRQVRIAGKLFNDDAPETTRLLTISGINVPVDIQLPDVAFGP